jgi:hypothetical protein
MTTQQILNMLIKHGATQEQVCAVLIALATTTGKVPAGSVRIGTVDEYVGRLMA